MTMRVLRSAFYAAAAFFLISCAVQPVQTQTTGTLNEALDQAVDDLFGQTQKLPAFLAKVESKLKVGTIVVDPLLDTATGQQTEVTRAAERRIIQRVQQRFNQYAVLPFTASEVGRAQYVLNGTIMRNANSSEREKFILNLALTEFKSGIVIAQAAARITNPSLDNTPTPFYRDSPVVVKDRGIEGYIRTSQTKPGQAADQIYLQRIPTSALIAEATTAYNAAKFAEALGLYETVSKRPDGQQLLVYNGLYLTYAALQRHDEAEKAFGMIVRLGLATNNLNVKFLFRPGSVDFLADPKISGPYPMWLRQIAQQLAQTDQCVKVVGHTSRTGAEQTNDRLSLQRANTVKKRLESELPTLAERLREAGMGYRENIIGSGTDDARDALDRRVEFRAVQCSEA